MGARRKKTATGKKSTLRENRRRIDLIDTRILKLLNDRARVVMQIGDLKKGRNSDLHVPVREMEIFERLSRLNKGPFPDEALRAIYREIISASLSLEGPLKVAYLGPEATFTHMACIRHFGSSAQMLPVNSIKEVFSEVERGHAEYGVVPIENSTEGVVNHTLDMFMDSPLKIVGEVMQEVSHHLLNKTGKIGDVRQVFSHPQAIAQCRVWLETNLPGVPAREVTSTAKAAENCKEDPSIAAIASDLAARLYRLRIIKKRIEDNSRNFTRFLVVSSKQMGKTGKDKTSVMFSVRDRVGALHDMLKPFSEFGLNMTKIESRPSRKKAWEYIFFVDLEGHQEEDRVRGALDRLEESCVFMKILGSYPEGTVLKTAPRKP